MIVEELEAKQQLVSIGTNALLVRSLRMVDPSSLRIVCRDVSPLLVLLTLSSMFGHSKRRLVPTAAEVEAVRCAALHRAMQERIASGIETGIVRLPGGDFTVVEASKADDQRRSVNLAEDLVGEASVLAKKLIASRPGRAVVSLASKLIERIDWLTPANAELIKRSLVESDVARPEMAVAFFVLKLNGSFFNRLSRACDGTPFMFDGHTYQLQASPAVDAVSDALTNEEPTLCAFAKAWPGTSPKFFQITLLSLGLSRNACGLDVKMTVPLVRLWELHQIHSAFIHHLRIAVTEDGVLRTARGQIRFGVGASPVDSSHDFGIPVLGIGNRTRLLPEIKTSVPLSAIANAHGIPSADVSLTLEEAGLDPSTSIDESAYLVFLLQHSILKYTSALQDALSSGSLCVDGRNYFVEMRDAFDNILPLSTHPVTSVRQRQAVITKSETPVPAVQPSLHPPLAKSSAPVLVSETSLARQKVSIKPREHLVVDGTNWIYLQRGTLSLGPLIALTALLADLDCSFSCFFDPGTKNKLTDLDRQYYDTLLTEFREVFHQVSSSKADPYILAQAEMRSARIISNDKYRDHKVQFPWVISQPERLIDAEVFQNNVLMPRVGLIISLDTKPEQYLRRLSERLKASRHVTDEA